MLTTVALSADTYIKHVLMLAAFSSERVNAIIEGSIFCTVMLEEGVLMCQDIRGVAEGVKQGFNACCCVFHTYGDKCYIHHH